MLTVSTHLHQAASALQPVEVAAAHLGMEVGLEASQSVSLAVPVAIGRIGEGLRGNCDGRRPAAR